MILLQFADEIEERFLIHGLDRAGDISMALLKGIVGPAAGPQQRLELGGEQIAELRRAVRPLVSDWLLVVAEVGEVERVSCRPASGARSCAWLPVAVGLPIRSEAHHLVLVAIMRKAEILRQRLVKDAERVQESKLGHQC